MSTAQHGRRVKGLDRPDDEGDGDIGLQGMSLDDQLPQQPSRSTMGAMMNLFSSQQRADPVRAPQRLPTPSKQDGQAATSQSQKPSSSDVARMSLSSTPSSSSQYHSADEEGSSPVASPRPSPAPTKQAMELQASEVPQTPTQNSFGRLKSDATTPKGKGRAFEENEDNSLMGTSSDPSYQSRRSSSSSVKRKGKEERRVQRRLSRLHNDIAGPPDERPLAGSTNGPAIAPRRTSASRRNSQASPSLRSSRTNSTGDHTADRLSSPNSASFSARPTAVLQDAGKPSSPSLPPRSAAQISFAPTESGQRGLGIFAAGEGGRPEVGMTKPLDEKAAGRGEALSTSSTSNAPASAPPTSFRSGDLSYDSVDEAALQRWVLSVGCVNFDLEKGPDLEFLYPSLGISREERDNIAFSSFPDTSIFDDGHAVFSWRVREVPLDSSGSEAPVIATPTAASTSTVAGNVTCGEAEPGAGTSGTWPRKTHGSGARRLFGGFDKSRNSRSNSGDDNSGDRNTASAPQTPQIEATRSPVIGTAETCQPSGTRLPVPQRQNSAASARSSISTDNNVSAQAGLNIVRTDSPAVAEQDTISSSIPVQKSSSTSSNYIHGYCFFRQKRDATIRRGYFQKSVVILSHLPYVSFFSELVRRLGPLFFEKGMPVLEAFCHDVQNWEPPEGGAKMHLPLLGTVISVELPYHSYSQASPLPEGSLGLPRNVLQASKSVQDKALRKINGSSEDEPILASIPNTPLFEVFKEAIGDLWLMWECLLLAEPILVVAPDPTACSEAVWHMLDLIKPIPYAGDFRPFFTIHDYDFRTLVTKNKPTAGTIIGVTNPFMLQACKHWPNVLKVGQASWKRSSNHSKRSSTADAQAIGSGGKLLGGVAGGNAAGGGGPEHAPGLASKRKRRISKDRTLIKQLADAAEGKGSVEMANKVLRSYFADLTERFLAPLNRYVSSLIPAEFDLSSPNETPRIKPFNSTAFLATLKMHGTPLPMKSRNLPTGASVRQSLYVDFLQCPNFGLWLHSRIRRSQEEQYMRKLAALEAGNVATYATTRGEVESMELYARLKVEIEGINDRLLLGRQEQELEPNSRWKCTAPTVGSVKDDGSGHGPGVTASGSADVAQQSLVAMAAPSPQLSSARSITSQPLDRLAALPPTAASSAWIRQTIGEPGWTRSFTHGERTLLLRKAGLIDQLIRLVGTFPEDLRQTLRLNEHQHGRSAT